MIIASRNDLASLTSAWEVAFDLTMATRTSWSVQEKTIDVLLNYSATLSVRHVKSADYQIATKRDQRVLIQVIILTYILHYLLSN